MKDRCFDPENLDKYLDLTEGDSDLEHLKGCSACRSLMLSYRSFLDPDDLPEGARSDLASVEMSRFLADNINTPEDEKPPLSLGTRLRSAWEGLYFKPILAAAALCLVLGFYWVGRDDASFHTPSGIVRELADDNAGKWRLSPVTHQPGGGLQLTWGALIGADSYRVELLGSSLIVVGSFEATGLSSLTLSVADLSSLTGKADFWRVVALAEGDEVGRSGTRSLSK
jgi:hypothetical protein